MATKPRKIAQSHWEEHKDTILGLYLSNDLSMEKLIETMVRDHGFTATLSQFEAQLRIWKARKRLRVPEWKRVLEKIDSLASRGINSRVLVSGHIVPTNKIRRARRHCQASDRSGRSTAESHDEDDENASDVVIETQNSSGQWSQYTVSVDGDAVPNQGQLHPSTVDQGHGIISPVLQPFAPDHIFDNWVNAAGNGNFLQPIDLSLPEYGISQPFVQRGPYVDNSMSYMDVTIPGLQLAVSPQRLTDLVQFPPATSHLSGLPFERFERDLALKRLHLTVSISPMQESRLFSRVQHLANMLTSDAASFMTETNGKTLRQNFEHVGLKLQRLHSIIPGPQQGELSQMTKEVEIHRLLLYSYANGFVGLEGVPIETIFKFLNESSNATSLLSRLFHDNPGHVVKSLAENLFKAAIESGDHNATGFLLRTRLVHVDKTFYIVDGQKYTALERACELQRLKVVKELLLFEPDVKTLFERKYIRYNLSIKGSLGLLIIGLLHKDESKLGTFSLEYLEVVELLIKAGVTIHSSSIRLALLRFARMDLSKKLLSRIAPSDHSQVFDGKVYDSDVSILQHIAEQLTDEETTKAITKILSDCEQTKCKQCLSRFSNDLNWAIVVGAKRGHIKFVRSLFQHAKSTTQILSAAIRSTKQELIDFVFAQKPDISHSSPVSIDGPRDTVYNHCTTPLAEAIKAKDDGLIRRLEDEGALEGLHVYTLEGFRVKNRRISQFSCAIAAASKVGNIEYMKKLLLHYPKASMDEMDQALVDSLENRQKNAVCLLLEFGADFCQTGYLRHIDPLVEGYKFGNQSVLTELMSTFPERGFFSRYQSNEGVELPAIYDHLFKDWEWGDMGRDMFDFFYQSGRLQRDHLTKCLIIAVKRDDIALLNDLLESGADAMNQHALAAAVDGHTDTLRILLEHIPQAKIPLQLFGTAAVHEAIDQYPSNIEALELLLACTAIDLKSIETTEHFVENHNTSPLGLAIVKDVVNGYSSFPLTTKLLEARCHVDDVVNVTRPINGLRVNKTAILVAIGTGNSNMVHFLIERGADVNKEAIHGIKRTPLQAAAEQGSLDLVELLLQKGADIHGKPAIRYGATALQCAAMSGNCNIAALLLDNGASLYDPPSTFNGRSPIEGAAENGRVDMIQFLWNTSLGMGFPVEECRRAMDLAEENGHIACKDLILELAVASEIILMIEMSG